MKNNLILFLLLILPMLVALSACKSAKQPYGHLCDSKTHLPLSGASIVLQRKDNTVYTDAKGYFSFDNIAVGNDDLIFSLKGYQTDTIPALFKRGGESIEYNMQGDTIFLVPLSEASVVAVDDVRAVDPAEALLKDVVQTTPVDSVWIGKYELTAMTDETTTVTSSITYSFEIYQDSVRLTTTTVHNPILCNGKYRAEQKGKELFLFYAGTERGCRSDDAAFRLKTEKSKYFIKGTGDESTYHEWVEIDKEM